MSLIASIVSLLAQVFSLIKGKKGKKVLQSEQEVSDAVSRLASNPKDVEAAEHLLSDK